MIIRKLLLPGLIGLLALTMHWGCGSTPDQGPDANEIRKNSDEGMRDLRMEEERQKR